jgi:hypothetical protein
LLLPLLIGACSRSGAPAGAEPRSSPALHLEGQRVLLLPLQAGVAGVDRATVEAALLSALEARQPRATWVGPDELRRAVRRSPGFAGTPDALAVETLRSPREHDVGEALAGPLRRYAALTDARLVLLPLELRRVVTLPDSVPATALTAVLIDTRTARVLWRGEGRAGGDPSREAAGEAAADLVRRAVAGRDPAP